MNPVRVTPRPVEPAEAAASSFSGLEACHDKTLEMLDELSTLVAQVERSGRTAATRMLATRIAAFFSTEARDHHVDEEQRVFPALLESGNPDAVQAVLRLERDHDALEEDWFNLAPHLLALASGDGVCDIDALRSGVAELGALYRDHIAFEESFVYPQASGRMAARRASA